MHLNHKQKRCESTIIIWKNNQIPHKYIRMSQPISTGRNEPVLEQKAQPPPHNSFTTPHGLINMTSSKCAKLYSITIALTVKHKAYLIILYTHAHSCSHTTKLYANLHYKATSTVQRRIIFNQGLPIFIYRVVPLTKLETTPLSITQFVIINIQPLPPGRFSDYC